MPGCLSLVLLTIASLSSGLQATREMLFSQMPNKAGKLTFIWVHHPLGGGDRGLPGDVYLLGKAAANC